MQDAPTRIQETYLEDPETDTGEGTAVQDAPEADEAEESEPDPEPRRPAGRGRVVTPPPKPVVPAAPVEPTPVIVPPRPGPPPVMAPKRADADLLAVWERWKQARARQLVGLVDGFATRNASINAP